MTSNNLNANTYQSGINSFPQLRRQSVALPSSIVTSGNPNGLSKHRNGIAVCDDIVARFCQILIDSNNVQNGAETYFLQQEDLLKERITVLEALEQNILEEKRTLESQLEECRTQVKQAREKKQIIMTESDQLSHCLSTDMSRIEHDEAILSQQHVSADKQMSEMRELMLALQKRFETLNEDTSELYKREMHIKSEESRLQQNREEAERYKIESDERKKELLEQESSINAWIKALNTRETEANKLQVKFLQRLEEIEAEERQLGLSPQKVARMNPAASFVSVRELMDDHGMTIDRDEEKEEIDTE